MCGFEGDREFRYLCTHVGHQVRFGHRVVIVARKAYAMFCAHARNRSNIAHEDFLRARPNGNRIGHHLTGFGFRDPVMRRLVLHMHFKVPVLPLPRRVIHERHKIDLSIVEQLFQNANRVVEGDIEPCVDPVIDPAGVAHRVKLANDLTGMRVGPAFAVTCTARKGNRGIGSGHTRCRKPGIQRSQSDLNRKIDPCARFKFQLDHVAMHVDESGIHRQVWSRHTAGHRAFDHLGNLSVFDPQRGVFHHTVGKHQSNIRDPHRSGPRS